MQIVFHQAEIAAAGNRNKGSRGGCGQQNLNKSSRCKDPGQHTGLLHSAKCG